MNRREETVTIIVPCYNVENYLPRCLDSLLGQTYQNLQVIMVEDCSTDKTRNIVRRYEKQYDNFRAIYNEVNGGLGNARNVGIEATSSKYIGFLDSDDWLPTNFVSEMYNTLVSQQADLSVCDVYLRYDDPSKDRSIVSFSGKPDKFGLINTGMAATSSAKLFKTDLFKDLKYPVGIVNEDIPVILALLSSCQVAYTNTTHFNYYQRPGSIQNGQVTAKRLDVFKALALLKENLGGKIDNKLWQAIVWQQIFAIYIYVFPRASGLWARGRLIRQFYELANENKITISPKNPGFREFLKDNRIDRFYGERAVKYLNSRKFLRASFLMAVYSFVQKNIKVIRRVIWLLRLSKLAALHPKMFAKKLIGRVRRASKRRQVLKRNVTMRDLVLSAKRQGSLSGKKSISVVIPNYNYERYMLQRIFSILYQKAKVGEIIILDDNSTDGSVKLAKQIKQYIGKYVDVRLINNAENQGTFSQWELGFREARYEYVWIAEADDYSSNKFLQTALGPLEGDQEIVISYVNTGYVNGDGLLLGNVKADIDYRGSGHWDHNYVNDGLAEARDYSYINNTIANVSSVLFRKLPGLNYAELFKGARKYRQAGDWVFYVNYMIHGDVAYTDELLNFYRVHGANVSSNTKAQDHIDEILDIQNYFVKKLDLGPRQKAKMAVRIKLLRKAWGI